MQWGATQPLLRVHRSQATHGHSQPLLTGSASHMHIRINAHSGMTSQPRLLSHPYRPMCGARAIHRTRPTQGLVAHPHCDGGMAHMRAGDGGKLDAALGPHARAHAAPSQPTYILSSLAPSNTLVAFLRAGLDATATAHTKRDARTRMRLYRVHTHLHAQRRALPQHLLAVCEGCRGEDRPAAPHPPWERSA